MFYLRRAANMLQANTLSRPQIGCLLCSSLTDLQYYRRGALWPANSHSSAAVAIGHCKTLGSFRNYIIYKHTVSIKQGKVLKFELGILRAQLENSIPGRIKFNNRLAS